MKHYFLLLIPGIFLACQNPVEQEDLQVEIFETSASGNKLKAIEHQQGDSKETSTTIVINPDKEYQQISGFGGAFTESSAHLLNHISKANRDLVLNAYFSEEGANYSLTRTHMNSCDFSLDHYSYTPDVDDTSLTSFSIQEDADDIIPMIKDAQSLSKDGFKIVASPWTAPPWMKDNNDWYGGKLKKEYYPSWAKFFSKYVEAYKQEGIDIWAFTVENEPLGNDSHWESMHYTPEEMADFVKNHMAPQLKSDGHSQKILVYDQNRGEELEEWANALLKDEELKTMIYGTAVHWYTGTQKWFPESLQHTHKLAPERSIIHTEGCIDAEVPHWKDDAWYWKQEATDWGWEWAKPENKHNHPKYVPTYRYARDIIGCLNNWVEGWIDWNMVLDQNGGPNLAQNWCVAPVLVDTAKNEVYFTPMFYVLSHFSKFIRPGANRIDFTNNNDSLMVTAAKNEDGSVVVVVLNQSEEKQNFKLEVGDKKMSCTISNQALQTLIIH